MKLNWANHKFLPVDGYGRFGLGFVRALLRNGHDVYPFLSEELDSPAWYSQARGLDFSHVTVQLMPPHNFRHLSGRSVGFSMHESMTLPHGWADHVNQKCQWLLVPHSWLIEVFKDAGVKVPIYVVGAGIDPDECEIAVPNRHRPFTIGCLGDRGGRKGNRETYTAFYKAFAHTNKDVRLIVKCRPGSLPNLDFSYSSDSRLTIWREDVTHMSDVFAQLDVFMFPTKCEGYGMPPRESSACGVPTVVTRWSGTDDETDEWAFPLDNFKMVESKMENCGGLWAQPDMDELIHNMRWQYEHQDDAKAQALKHAQWLRDNRTYARAAVKLVDTVSQCLGARRLPERTKVTA
jgi:glycosyltransferase involved in cell wall biosynthesis